MKKIAFGAISILFSVLVFAIVGELAIRSYHFINEALAKNSVKFYSVDKYMGWLPTPDFFYEGEVADAAGNTYSLNIRTDSLGFRAFGDTGENRRKKVLFLGDSFTQAMQVSDDKTYYSLLQAALPIEPFALGVGGYGTLQELMILETYIDEVKPDIVVLQFCPNDIINNHFALESLSTRNNNGMMRPYYSANGIEYKLPRSYPFIRHFANNYSRFLYFIIKNIDLLNAGKARSVENTIEQQGMGFDLFRESVEITDILVGKIRQRVPATIPVFAFSTDDNFHYYQQFARISAKHGIDFMEQVPQALRVAEQNGVPIRAADTAHWNNAGHEIVAKAMADYIKPKLP